MCINQQKNVLYEKLQEEIFVDIKNLLFCIDDFSVKKKE